MFDLSGKVALVTGASRGIGRAAAHRLSERGATVIAAARGDHAAACVADITGAGRHAEALSVDVTDASALERVPAVRSVVGQMGNAGQTNYAASKAGLIGFVKALAREVASRGITVNAIAPGMIDTEMTRTMADRAHIDWSTQIPVGRLGTVDEIAAAACFLASDEASYITGHVLAVNGGMYM